MAEAPGSLAAALVQLQARLPREPFDRLAEIWRDYVAENGPIPNENSYHAGYLRGLELAAQQLEDRIRWAGERDA